MIPKLDWRETDKEAVAYVGDIVALRIEDTGNPLEDISCLGAGHKTTLYAKRFFAACPHEVMILGHNFTREAAIKHAEGAWEHFHEVYGDHKRVTARAEQAVRVEKAELPKQTAQTAQAPAERTKTAIAPAKQQKITQNSFLF